MRILKDSEDDIWVELKYDSGHFVMSGDDREYAHTEEYIRETWGPLTEMRLVEA